MRHRLLMLSGWIVVMAWASGCSKFRRYEKNEDWRVKYEAGLNYFAKKDYYRSAVLFEQILPIVRGLPEGEKVEFNLAYCQYYEKTYLLAANQFRLFYETYGRSSLAEEAHFMYAYSLYASTPDINLDQKNSLEAMAAMQNFLNRYPASTFRERAAAVINECQLKLEQKGFANARHYVKLGYYQAAVLAFDDFKRNFPDSRYLEEAAFLKVEAQFNWAERSLPNRQLERYQAAITYYQELVDNFPQSAYLKSAERYYTNSMAQINKLKPKNS